MRKLLIKDLLKNGMDEALRITAAMTEEEKEYCLNNSDISHINFSALSEAADRNPFTYNYDNHK